MAYLVGSALTFATATATVSANMPPHQADDYLIVYITTDSGTVTLPTSGGGGGAWAALTGAPANPVSNGIVTYLAFLKATSAAETFPSVLMPDAYTCTVLCFRDVNTTLPFDGVTPINTTSAAGYTATATAPAATNTADSLVVYLWAQETPSTTPSQVLVGPGVMWIDGHDAGGTTATTSAHQCLAWHILRTANTAGPTPIAVSGVTSTWTKASFCLRNKSGGRIPAYIDDYISPGSMITGGQHIVAANNITATTNGITATINGKTATPATATNVGDVGINFFCNGLTSGAAATAATALVGPEITLTTALNASTGGLVMGAVIGATTKQSAVGLGTVANGGVVVRFGSGAAATTLWNAYQVAAKDAKVVPINHAVFAIEAGYAGSAYATGAGGNCSASAVKFIQVLRNAPYFSSQMCLTELHYVGKQVIAGGTATDPVGIDGLVACGRSFRLPVIQQAGSGGVVSFAPLQIGGADVVNFQIDASALQFPTRASAAAKDLQYHASDNKVGIDFAGKSGDVIKLTNSVVTAGTPYYFSINAAATSAATWDFSGTLVVNGTVTMRPVMTFTGMNFADCPSVTLNASTVTSCNFDNSPVVAASPTEAALVSACGFTSSGTGHAMTIGSAIAVPGSPASITLTDLTFTGYAATNGSTGNEAINVLYTSGTLTINYTSASTPYIKTAGATVIVQNSKPVTVTVKDAGTLAAIESARVRVVTTVGGNVVIEGLTNASGVLTGSTTYIGSAVTGTIRRASAGLGDGKLYKPYEISGAVSAEGLDVSALMTSDE